MNLLKIKYIRGLFKARWFPIVPQLFMLAIFVLLVAGGLGVTADDPDFVYFLRSTNLSNLKKPFRLSPIRILLRRRAKRSKSFKHARRGQLLAPASAVCNPPIPYPSVSGTSTKALFSLFPQS